MMNPYKTISSIKESFNINRSKSMNNFILMNKNREIEQNY